MQTAFIGVCLEFQKCGINFSCIFVAKKENETQLHLFLWVSDHMISSIIHSLLIPLYQNFHLYLLNLSDTTNQLYVLMKYNCAFKFLCNSFIKRCIKNTRLITFVQCLFTLLYFIWFGMLCSFINLIL